MTDRDAFGNWLSGFVDGEGCFLLKHFRLKRASKTYDMPGATFEILLRADELPILQEIKEFLKVGRIHAKPCRGGNQSPAASFVVSSTPELVKGIITHFDRYPLRAKKARDYFIWRQAVLILHEVYLRPRPGRPGGGTLPKWTDMERENFFSLRSAMMKQRVFLSATPQIQACP